MIDFELGTIFTLDVYPLGFKFATDNGYTIEEIEPKGEERQFMIVELYQPTEEELKQARISELKQLLSETDYKIIKCYEASMLSQELPYNLEELVAERNEWRAEISNLGG